MPKTKTVFGPSQKLSEVRNSVKMRARTRSKSIAGDPVIIEKNLFEFGDFGLGLGVDSILVALVRVLGVVLL